MRLSISLCKHCLIDREDCEHYKTIHQGTKAIKTAGTLIHHCRKYYECLPTVAQWQSSESEFGLVQKPIPKLIADAERIGARVEIELRELEYATNYYRSCDDPSDGSWEWVSAGWVKGSIIGHKNNDSGFFIIKLDEPVNLCLPPPKGEGGWQDAELIEVQIRLKRAKDIKLLKGEQEYEKV